eukprot:227083-Amphidinium_carterae.1
MSLRFSSFEKFSWHQQRAAACWHKCHARASVSTPTLRKTRYDSEYDIRSASSGCFLLMMECWLLDLSVSVVLEVFDKDAVTQSKLKSP